MKNEFTKVVKSDSCVRFPKQTDRKNDLVKQQNEEDSTIYSLSNSEKGELRQFSVFKNLTCAQKSP